MYLSEFIIVTFRAQSPPVESPMMPQPAADVVTRYWSSIARGMSSAQNVFTCGPPGTLVHSSIHARQIGAAAGGGEAFMHGFQIGAGEETFAQIDAAHIGADEDRAAQAGTAQIGAYKARALQIGIAHIGAEKGAVVELGFAQIGIMQAGAGQIGMR